MSGAAARNQAEDLCFQVVRNDRPGVRSRRWTMAHQRPATNRLGMEIGNLAGPAPQGLSSAEPYTGWTGRPPGYSFSGSGRGSRVT